MSRSRPARNVLRSTRSLLARWLAASLALLAGHAVAVPLAIPSSHPRLWFGNAARLQQAREHLAAHPFDPGADPYLRALRGVLTGNQADCAAAAHHFEGREIETRDEFRWESDGLVSIFDWCHAQFSPDQVARMVERWNGYMDRERLLSEQRHIGDEGDEANNYWWGDTRTYLMWGIASHGVNERAQEFIDFALDTRFGAWFTTWYRHFGREGVFPEGADYGIVTLAYPLVAFATAADFGFDPYAHTPYFREALYALIYGTTPGPSWINDESPLGMSFFPFNDDETFHLGGAINAREYVGDFLRFLAARDDSGNAGHANAWLRRSGAHSDWLLEALGEPAQVGDLDALPLDYFARGAQVFAARTSHGPDATQLHAQLGTPGGTAHRHLDAGNFQLWRKGRWLTRESTGYANRIVAYGEPSGSSTTVDSSAPPAHNALLVQGRSTAAWAGYHAPRYLPPGGSMDADDPLQLPLVRRLQHADAFAFIATDYSGAYRHHRDTRLDWPYADRVWRELLFIRPLQALIVFDRVRTSSDSLRPYYHGSAWYQMGPNLAAEDVVRSFLMHFEHLPTVQGNRVTAPAGTQTAELITMLPRSPAFRVVNEDVPGHGEAGQYRVELDDSGSADGYFLNVVTGYDAGEPVLQANLVEQASTWTLNLVHPTRGSASVVLAKGMESHGGSISIDGAQPVAFNTYVQGMRVDDDGPWWFGDPRRDLLFADGYEW